LLSLRTDEDRLRRFEYYIKLIALLLEDYGELGPNYMMAAQIYYALVTSPVQRIKLSPAERLQAMYKSEVEQVEKEHPRGSKKSSKKKGKEAADAAPSISAERQRERDRRRHDKKNRLKAHYEPLIKQAKENWASFQARSDN